MSIKRGRGNNERALTALPFLMIALTALVVVALVVFWHGASERVRFSPQGLLVYYPLDAIDTASDEVKEEIGGYTGRIVNGQQTEGVYTNALRLSQGTLNTGLDVDLESDFTLSAWVKLAGPISSTGRQKLIAKEFWGVLNSSYSLYVAPQEQVWFSFNALNNPNPIGVHSSTSLSIGNWHLITVSLGKDLTLYIDGAVAAQTTGVSTRPYNADVALLIGSTQNGTNLNQPTYIDNFEGDIDDVRIYDTALTTSQVASMYQEGLNYTLRAWYTLDAINNNQVVDSAPYHITGSVLGNPSVVAGMVEPNALSFDGVDDYIRVPDNDVINLRGGSFTLSAWVKTTSQSPLMILEKNGAPTPGFKNYGIYMNASSFRFFARCDNPSGQDMGSTVPVNDGNWHYVVAVRDGITDKRYVYIDGVLSAQATDTQCDDFSSTAPLYIGARLASLPSPGILFNGSMDDVKIYSRALTAAEITAEYQQGLVVVTAPSNPSGGGSSGSGSGSNRGGGSSGSTINVTIPSTTQPTNTQPTTQRPTGPTGTIEIPPASEESSTSTWFYVVIILLGLIILAALIGLGFVILRKKPSQSSPAAPPATAPIQPRPPFSPMGPPRLPFQQQPRPMQPLAPQSPRPMQQPRTQQPVQQPPRPPQQTIAIRPAPSQGPQNPKGYI